MIGTKNRATQNIIVSVSSLEVASQRVSALARFVDEGITNGKSVNPVISMIDAIDSELRVNAKPLLPTLAIALVSSGSTTEPATRAQSRG